MNTRAMNPDRITVLFREAYRKLTSRHKKRWGGEPCITLAEFKAIVTQPCVYCGFEASNEVKDRNPRGGIYSETVLRVNGVDRKDSRLGYTAENTQTACRYCNSGKNVHQEGFFLHWVAEVYHKRVEGTEHDF